MLRSSLAAVAAALLVLAPLPAAAVEAEGVAPAGAGFTGEIQIVYINDVHGAIAETDASIGYPRIGAFIDEARAANPNTVVLDAGDVIAGSPYAAVDQGLGFVPILNTLGIDAMTAGNAEYMFGLPVLDEFMTGVDYPVLSGNMVRSGTGDPVAPGHALIDLPNGMTVGVVGVTTPAAVADGVAYTDAVASARRSVDAARGAGADIVVGLTHLGELDPQMNVDVLTREVAGLDVVIDGHSHTLYPEGVERNGVLVAQAGANGEHLGTVTLTVTDGEVTGAAARTTARAELGDLAPKTSTQAELDAFLQRAEAYLDEPIGSTSVHLDGSRNALRTGETNLGNLFTDAVRERTGTDLALILAGIMGGEIQPGDLTRRDINAIARIDTPLVTARLTGRQIVAYLEDSAAALPQPSGGFVHVSGGSYAYDLAQRPEPIVHSVAVGGKPIDPDASYSVTLVAGVAPQIGATDVAEAGSTAEILEAHVRAHPPVAPAIEGRIVAAEKPAEEPDPEPTDPEPTDPEPEPTGPGGDSGDATGGAARSASAGDDRLAATGAEPAITPLAASLLLLASGALLAGPAARRRRQARSS